LDFALPFFAVFFFVIVAPPRIRADQAWTKIVLALPARVNPCHEQGETTSR